MKKFIIVCAAAVSCFTASAQKQNAKTETFKVFGTCMQCKKRIENTLKDFGTYKANWEIATNMLTVSFDSVVLSKLKLQQQLAIAGHDNEAFQSDDKTYERLPICCHYERYQKAVQQQIAHGAQNDTASGKILHTVTGIVLEENRRGKLSPLTGANVRCLKTNHGSSTDSSGVFQLICLIPARIEVSYVGYKSDTITISSPGEIKVLLKNSTNVSLGEVIVKAKDQSTHVSTLSTFNTLNIGAKELVKAACCNLSESFETSPSVDVSYADAVTGIRQIQLLGLSGNYTQLLTENTPEIKGLAGSYGLTFIPGQWIDGIQVTKGTGSVANGYESIAGQINVEEKKPEQMDRLFVNAYANAFGRFEVTSNASQEINSKWSTALLTHANIVAIKNDGNNDGFLDLPVGGHINLLNRWRYADTRGVFAQFALKALDDHRQAGETGFNPSTDKLTRNKYGVGIHAQQFAFTGKLGYVFPRQKYKSIGFIFSANTYNNNSYYGLTEYNGKQNSVYGNFIYQSIVGNTAHKFRTGLSFASDHYHENYNAAIFKRKEIVPGAFIEYTYTGYEKFTVIAGLRIDYHNEYRWMATPRLHLKYDITPETNLRFSAGSGFRTANIFAENTGLFASSRQYNILNPSTNYGYGLDPEKAWNYGFNFIHNFKLNNRRGSAGIDLYRTTFSNQVIVDVDANPQQVNFYNLAGKSFSKSFQAALNYELFRKLEVRLAYRWLDVQANYHGSMLGKALVAKHRAFINLAYETKNNWKFDLTSQWFSKKRLPATGTNPAGKQMGSYSPSFLQMSGQVTKQFFSKWDVYIGGENLTGYRQHNLFIDGSTPFSPYFDGSIVWGPVNGRMLYAGLRFKIK